MRQYGETDSLDLNAFGYALHGLRNDLAKVEGIKPVLLECINAAARSAVPSSIGLLAALTIIHHQLNTRDKI
jgi:hypothetical protein